MAEGQIRRRKKRDGSWSYTVVLPVPRHIPWIDPKTGERPVRPTAVETFSKLSDAQRWRAAKLTEFARGKGGNVNAETTVLEVVELWAERTGPECTPGTRQNREQWIKHHFRNDPVAQRPVRQATAGEYDEYKARLTATRDTRSKSRTGPAPLISPRTVNDYLSHLRAALNWMSRVYDLDEPAIALRKVAGAKQPPTRDTTMSLAQGWDLADVAEVRRTDMRGSILFQLATGMRIGELLAVRKSDVNFFAKTVRVDRQMHPDLTYGPPKTVPAGYRTIPLEDEDLQHLARHMELFPPLQRDDEHDGLIFYTITAGQWGVPGRVLSLADRHPGPWRPSSYRRWFNTLMRECGSIPPELRGTSTHELRKSYTSTMMAAGVNPIDLARWLGHANANMIIEVYGKLVPGADERARKARRAAIAEAREALQLQDRPGIADKLRTNGP